MCRAIHPFTASPKYSKHFPSSIHWKALLFLLKNYLMIHWSRVRFYLSPWLKCIVCALSSEVPDTAHIIFNLPSIFIGPNYCTLLGIITLNYKLKRGQRFTHSGLLPTVSPLRLPHCITFSVEFRQRSSVAKKLQQFHQRLSALWENECPHRLVWILNSRD